MCSDHAESHLNLAISYQQKLEELEEEDEGNTSEDLLGEQDEHQQQQKHRRRLELAVYHAKEALSVHSEQRKSSQAASPSYGKAHHTLANALQALGDMDGARKHWSLADDYEVKMQQQQQQQHTSHQDASTNTPRVGETNSRRRHLPPWMTSRDFLQAGDRIHDSATGLTVEVLSAGGLGSAPESGGRDGSMHQNGPLLFAIDDFLSVQECDHLIRSASQRLSRSFVVGGESAGTEETGGAMAAQRTSTNAWVPPGKDAVLRGIRERAAALLGFFDGVERDGAATSRQFLDAMTEDLQVVRCTYDAILMRFCGFVLSWFFRIFSLTSRERITTEVLC